LITKAKMITFVCRNRIRPSVCNMVGIKILSFYTFHLPIYHTSL